MMTPRKSVIRRLATSRILQIPLWRRLVTSLALATCAILALFPQPYLGAMTLAPTNPGGLGLSSTLGQPVAVQSVFGNQAAIEVSLRIGGSDCVRGLVDDKLKMGQRLQMLRTDTLRWMQRRVNVCSLRGGIIQFDLKLHDADLARDTIATYVAAIREPLVEISRNQTTYKHKILVNIVQKKRSELGVASIIYDNFLLHPHYISLQASIRTIGERVPRLENAIKRKQVDLNAEKSFFTGENLIIQQNRAQIDALQRQFAVARSASPAELKSVGHVALESTEVNRLRRNLEQGFYDRHTRYPQGISVEDLSSPANIIILYSPYIVVGRQYNSIFAAALEFYLWRLLMVASAT